MIADADATFRHFSFLSYFAFAAFFSASSFVISPTHGFIFRRFHYFHFDTAFAIDTLCLRHVRQTPLISRLFAITLLLPLMPLRHYFDVATTPPHIFFERYFLYCHALLFRRLLFKMILPPASQQHTGTAIPRYRTPHVTPFITRC